MTSPPDPSADSGDPAAFAAFAPHTGAIHAAHRPPQGTNAAVTLLTAERGRFVVKRGDTEERAAELAREAVVLGAISAERPFVPALLARDEAAGRYLFTFIEGTDLATAAAAMKLEAEKVALVWGYARALRRIHAWTPDLPRPADWVGWAAERARANAAASPPGTVLEAGHGALSGRPVRALAERLGGLLAGSPPDIVFCHGDWCLPNVLSDEGRVVGAVDWGDGAYADRRYDLATALWSLDYNGLGHLAAAFLSAYDYAGGGLFALAPWRALYALL